MEAARDDLRHTEVFTADFEQLTGIDVSLEGEDYALSCQKAEDEMKSTCGSMMRSSSM